LVTGTSLDAPLALAITTARVEQVEAARAEFERARADSPVASRGCVESTDLEILGDGEGEGCWWVGAAISLAGTGAALLAAAAYYACPGAIAAGPIAVGACLTALGGLSTALSALAALIHQHSSCNAERIDHGRMVCEELWESVVTVTQLYPDFLDSVEFSDLMTAWTVLNCDELIGGSF